MFAIKNKIFLNYTTTFCSMIMLQILSVNLFIICIILIDIIILHKIILQYFQSILGRDLNVLIYIRRRIAMCCRKLRKLKEASKMFRDVSLRKYLII